MQGLKDNCRPLASSRGRKRKVECGAGEQLCVSCAARAVQPQLQPCWRLIQLVTQRETQKQYDQLSSSKIISVSIMSSALNTNCLLLGLLPIRTIIKNYLPFVLSCPLSNNFLSLHFFYLRAGHLSSSWL